MRNRLSLVFSFLASTLLVFSQAKPPSSDPQSLIRGQGEGGQGYIRSFNPPTGVEGSSLVYDDPVGGTVHLSNGQSTKLTLMNLDLNNQSVLIGVNDRLYEIPGDKVDSVILDSGERVFNSRYRFKTDKQLVFEILKGADYSMYKIMEVKLLKPDYNVALNVGSRNYRFNKTAKFYLHDVQSDDMREIKKAKDLKDLENFEGIRDFIRSNNISLKRDADLRALARFMNE